MKYLSTNQKLNTRNKGFTIVELVTVIVIMGVLAVGISSFLQFGSQIYAETSSREQLISSARFAVERLNREVRHALPNSFTASGLCLEFTPIAVSTVYTDIPVFPEAARNTISVIDFDQTSFVDGLRAIVYPLKPSDVDDGNDKAYNIVNSGLNSTNRPWIITLDAVVNFKNDSPTQRVFFIEDNVSYCVNASEELLRTQGGNSVLMAEKITNLDVFRVDDATLQRNAVVHIKLIFEDNFEKVPFNNEIQVPNVP